MAMGKMKRCVVAALIQYYQSETIHFTIIEMVDQVTVVHIFMPSDEKCRYVMVFILAMMPLRFLSLYSI